MDWIKNKIIDIISIGFVLCILFLVKKIKILYSKTHYEAEVNYIKMLSTAEYFSSSFPISKKLVSKIEKNTKKVYNFITLKYDRYLLQKYYNKNIKAKDLHKAKELIRGYQIRIFDMAKEIVLPYQNEIGFSLNGGTLIGALRHDGFIPWDDDMDFDILRDDCSKLQKIIKEKYIFVDPSECKCYEEWYCLVDKAIREHPNEIVWTNAKGFFQAYKGISFMDCAFCDFFVWEFIKPGVTFSEYRKWWNEFAKVYRNPNLTWGEIRDIYLNELNSNKIFSTRDNCQYIACALTQFSRTKPARFEKLSTFLPYKKHKFEDTEFYIANDYNTYLKRDIKDWTKIPTEIQFAKHVDLYENICPLILSEEFYMNYKDVCEQEGYHLPNRCDSNANN